MRGMLIQHFVAPCDAPKLRLGVWDGLYCVRGCTTLATHPGTRLGTIPYKFPRGTEMYLLVKPNATKSWRYRFVLRVDCQPGEEVAQVTRLTSQWGCR